MKIIDIKVLFHWGWVELLQHSSCKENQKCLNIRVTPFHTLARTCATWKLWISEMLLRIKRNLWLLPQRTLHVQYSMLKYAKHVFLSPIDLWLGGPCLPPLHTGNTGMRPQPSSPFLPGRQKQCVGSACWTSPSQTNSCQPRNQCWHGPWFRIHGSPCHWHCWSRYILPMHRWDLHHSHRSQGAIWYEIPKLLRWVSRSERWEVPRIAKHKQESRQACHFLPGRLGDSNAWKGKSAASATRNSSSIG